jgi:hypothetical protein
MIMSAPASSSTSPSGQKSRRHGLWGLLPFIAAVGILALALLDPWGISTENDFVLRTMEGSLEAMMKVVLLICL